MTKYWFRPKYFGYGLVPISWQGWVMTLIFVGILYVSAYVNGFTDTQISTIPTSRDEWRFLLDVLVFTTLFMIVAKDKTNGPIQWNWKKTGKWF
ncbi:MAG: hypothetical protein WC753_04215 [Candidatus Gracilibacteria bacterium]|jgi:hypothetical protein